MQQVKLYGAKLKYVIYNWNVLCKVKGIT